MKYLRLKAFEEKALSTFRMLKSKEWFNEENEIRFRKWVNETREILTGEEFGDWAILNEIRKYRKKFAHTMEKMDALLEADELTDERSVQLHHRAWIFEELYLMLEEFTDELEYIF